MIEDIIFSRLEGHTIIAVKRPREIKTRAQYDRIVVMDSGRIIDVGPRDDITKRSNLFSMPASGEQTAGQIRLD